MQTKNVRAIQVELIHGISIYPFRSALLRQFRDQAVPHARDDLVRGENGENEKPQRRRAVQSDDHDEKLGLCDLGCSQRSNHNIDGDECTDE